MPPIPPYLIFLTLIFVVLPSVLAILLRAILHRYLVFLTVRVRRLLEGKARGKQPKIIEELEQRFAETSKNLDRVNSAALIDRVYSQQKVLFFYCEQIDYYCRILPNLLLAFGLIGTFLGITINLSSLSQTIGQTNASDVASLVQELQAPLQGMGIAFTTSLTAILFSALLTVVNFLFNTSLVKYQLICSLEDYLDNVYNSTLQGQTRLDKIVKGMADSFDNFLTRFGQTVREAVEGSLKAKLQEIFDSNIEATKLAKEVYSRLAEASGTIHNGADRFKTSADDLANSVSAIATTADRFERVGEVFEYSQFAQRLSEATADLASTQSEFYQSASILAESVQSIKKAVTELRRSSQQFVNFLEEFSNLNITSRQILNLQENHQQSFDEIVAQLQQGLPSSQAVIDLQKQMMSKAETLDKVQIELTSLVETLSKYTEGVSLGIQSVGDRITENNYFQFQATMENLTQTINHLNDIKYEIYSLRQTLEKRSSSESIDESTLDEIVDKLNQI